MSLKEYQRKRNFAQTPEPQADPTEAVLGSSGRFFVQRHDATRLHYDFRLEIDGTLKSWAVPKGPSLQPLSKSLAMMVEDHPISYGDFEGNIPKGNYGGGSVMLWDRGTFDLLGDVSDLEQIARGDLKIRLHGEKLKGEFAVIRMKGRGKGNEWLLIKKRDGEHVEGWDIESFAYSVKTGRTQEEIANDLEPAPKKRSGTGPKHLTGAVKATMPASITPMAATPATKPPPGSDWIYEVKWDGVRVICYIQDGTIRMVSRNQNSYDRQFPELTVVPHYVSAETAILDGEIAVLDEKGRSGFQLIAPRIHQTDPNSIAHLARRTPSRLFVFDLLYWDGYDLRAVPLLERKQALASVIQTCPRMQLSEHFSAKGEEMLAAAVEAGLEGIMAKHSTSRYEERRSPNWLKIKVTGRQEFIICGYTHGERETFSSLVLGQYQDGKLMYVGNVGTGFDDKALRALFKAMEPLVTDRVPFAKKPAMLRRATWVQPELVCEVKFGEWTREGRLRAPVFMGLRADKKAEECIKEQPANSEPPAQEERHEGPLLPKKVKEVTTTIDGRVLKFTNLDKLYYPKDHCTKRDILNYYDAVAPLILPYLQDRPLSLKRYPNGIDQDFFFQKDTPESAPDWLRIEPIFSDHRQAPIRYVVADDRSTLLYLTNLGCIDQNPWMSRIGSLDNPDYVLIDLDPQECEYEKIVEAALLVKEKLDLLGMEGCPKTTGGDGMHIFIPVEPRYSYEQIRSFAEILSQLVTGENPDLFTTPRAVAKRRKNRVYFDYLQISTGKTISAPYVLRAYPGAPVSTPLNWNEVKPGLTPHQFHIGNAVQRFNKVGDLFGPVLSRKQRLEPALRKLTKLMD